MITWLYVHLGIAGTGPYYGFWSGFGSDIGEVTVLGLVLAVFRKHNCHARRCWRIGRHQVEGTVWTTCRKHHPAIDTKAPSAEQIKADHRSAMMLAALR